MTNDSDFRPTWLDEVAARIMAANMTDPDSYGGDYRSFSAHSYDAAEALIAEGRRRRGNGE